MRCCCDHSKGSVISVRQTGLCCCMSSQISLSEKDRVKGHFQTARFVQSFLPLPRGMLAKANVPALLLTHP